jgi:RNA polymerase sigma-70 factor (ECF subfamily)
MNSADEFQAIVCDHYQALFRFALSLARVEADAQDLTQETFHIWAIKGHQLKDISKVRNWLYTTLYRVFLQGRRHQMRFSHHELVDVEEELPPMVPAFADQVDSSDVLSALTRVDEPFQAAVALFYLDQFSYKDIAEILEVPVGTVKSRIARGIKQLKKMLFSAASHASFRSETRACSAPAPGPFAARPRPDRLLIAKFKSRCSFQCTIDVKEPCLANS